MGSTSLDKRHAGFLQPPRLRGMVGRPQLILPPDTVARYGYQAPLLGLFYVQNLAFRILKALAHDNPMPNTF